MKPEEKQKFLKNKEIIKEYLYWIKSVIWNFENIDDELLQIDYILEKLKIIKKYNKELIKIKFKNFELDFLKTKKNKIWKY